MGLLLLMHRGIGKILQSEKTARAAFVKDKVYTSFDRIGEIITYDVRFGKLHMGKAVFRNVGKSEVNGKSANLITFETKVTGLHDLETIYCEPVNFLPLKIKRRINNLSIREEITENYDQQRFILTITKVKGKNKEQSTIKKNSVIHNAVLLPFYVRHIPKPDIGWTIMAQLPTQQFLIKLVSIEEVSVPAGKFKCYHFESSPKKFEIWVSVDNRRLPVKIKGLGVLGYTILMQEYNF
jgi:hypothetical protein